MQRLEAAVLPVEIHPLAEEVLIVKRHIVKAQPTHGEGRGDQQHRNEHDSPAFQDSRTQQQKKGEQRLGDQYQDNSEVHTNLLHNKNTVYFLP